MQHLQEVVFGVSKLFFAPLPGVLDVQSGYMGGDSEQPSYEEVCGGRSGHREVVHILYDSEKVAYETLLQAFWSGIDQVIPEGSSRIEGTSILQRFTLILPSKKHWQSRRKKSYLEKWQSLL